MRGTLASANTGKPEDLLRCGPVEPRDVDTHAQLPVLAWAGSRARWWAAIALHSSCLLNLLGCLGDELLSDWCLVPSALFAEARTEAHLHMVPNASLVVLARSEDLQRRTPEASLRGVPGAPSYARWEGTPSVDAGLDATSLDALPS